MAGETRVLVVGRDGDEVSDVASVVTDLLQRRCTIVSMELDTSSVDPSLAWGTEGPRVVEHRAGPLRGAVDEPDSTGEEQPLPEDGDTWKAIAHAARRYDIQLVAAVEKQQGWWSRLFSGSAAHDLVVNAGWPVLLVPADALAARSTTRVRSRGASTPSPDAATPHDDPP
jgi:nucleotide-binding universal stress UspA family protein